MHALFKENATELRIDIIAEKHAQDFINTHAQALDAAFEHVPMSDNMRQRLQRSDYIFSGIKTFHELNEAFPSLIDENGNRKPFERFLKDVQKVHQEYNVNYLRAEYNFAAAAAANAAKWEKFAQDGDNYYLQYRTARDNRVREEHSELDGITLPMSDDFWESFFPPNGWNCRCTVVQVRKTKYPVTPHELAMERGEAAMKEDKKGMFRFNPGAKQQTFPDYNPYTSSRCSTCTKYKSKKNELAADVTTNDMCEACSILHQYQDNAYKVIPTERGKLRIHVNHGKNEQKENVEIAQYLACKYGYAIDLLPKVEGAKSADSFNYTLMRKQEYKVNSTPTKNAVDLLLRNAKKQANSIVIKIKSDISMDILCDAITGRISRCPNVTDITLIYKDKDVTYTREEMLRKPFKIKREDFK